MKKLMLSSMVAIAMSVASAQAGDFTVKVDGDFWEDDISWTGGLGKAYDFAGSASATRAGSRFAGSGISTIP